METDFDPVPEIIPGVPSVSYQSKFLPLMGPGDGYDPYIVWNTFNDEFIFQRSGMYTLAIGIHLISAPRELWISMERKNSWPVGLPIFYPTNVVSYYPSQTFTSNTDTRVTCSTVIYARGGDTAKIKLTISTAPNTLATVEQSTRYESFIHMAFHATKQ